MQDYYVILKFNQGEKSIKGLYRLCLACCMLHDNKNSGTLRGHPYPKVMLSFMLVLQHWRDTDYCGYQMMIKNMAIFNEELGELTFAILARSTMGDHTKDDFEHMDRLFRLLAVYRDVKSDVVADNNASRSLNWRHKIKKDGEEVTNTVLFFKQAIRQMVNGTYTSYDGSSKSYSTALNGSIHKVRPDNPPVYMSKIDVTAYVRKWIDKVREEMSSNYLYPYRHIWPECLADDDQKHNTDIVAELDPIYEEKVEELRVDGDNSAHISPQEDDEEDVCSDATKESEDNDGSDASEESRIDPDQHRGPHPLHSRTWKAWGRVNEENTVVGKRARTQPTRFQYNGRRRGAKFPTAPT